MRYVLLVTIVLLSTAAFAQSPTPDPIVGARSGAFSARSLSLGHAYLTTETGPAALEGNPATLARQESRWQFNLSGDISRVHEARKYPFYDAFDGVLNYNNYALNDHLFSKLEGGVAWRAPVNAVESLVLSAGTYSAYRFDYRYSEEVRDRFASGGIMDRKLGENRLDVSGDLRTISLGAAARMRGPLAVGFGLNLLSGDWTYLRGVYYENPDSANIEDRADYTPQGTPGEATFGFTYDASERVVIGARALLPTGDLKADRATAHRHGDTLWTSSGDVRIVYPSHFALGIQYRPRGEYRPLLLLEGEWHTWSDVNPAYNNTFEIRAGAEQQVVPGAPVRLGFVYSNSPGDKDRATALFTAGIGFTLQRLSGDFGVELGRMNYLSADLFPQSLYGDTDRTDLDRVETALFRGIVTLKYSL